MYERENAPLYTNKIKDLPNYDVFRTTRVALGILPPLNYFGGSDYDGDGGGIRVMMEVMKLDRVDVIEG